jgi:hypothetical protein
MKLCWGSPPAALPCENQAFDCARYPSMAASTWVSPNGCEVACALPNVGNWHFYDHARHSPLVGSCTNCGHATDLRAPSFHVLSYVGPPARGNEVIKAGTIVCLTRGGSSAGDGGFTAEYYAHTVQHEFVPYRSYVTTRVIRSRHRLYRARATRGRRGLAVPSGDDLPGHAPVVEPA